MEYRYRKCIFGVTHIGKVYIKADKEFASVGLEGHTLVIVKALYGLKSSGLHWWEVLADVLDQMGFVPSRAEGDIWM